jgi:phage FluMu protein Com
MIKITCFNCHSSWSLNREEIEAALTSLKPGATHYTVECPKCRRVNKITVRQLQRALPTPPAHQDTSEQEK